MYHLCSALSLFSGHSKLQKGTQSFMTLSEPDTKLQEGQPASSCCLRSEDRKCHWPLARGCYDLLLTGHQMPGKASRSTISAGPRSSPREETGSLIFVPRYRKLGSILVGSSVSAVTVSASDSWVYVGIFQETKHPPPI